MLLSVKNLSTEFPVKKGIVRAVEDVSFDVDQGEILAIVGESGSGKSVTSLSIMGLLAEPGHVAGGSLEFEGKDLATLSEKQYRELRGNDMAMIFQEPMTSLNPVYRVGNQIVEAIRTHEKVSKAEAKDRAVDLLRKVGIPSPEARINDYPHQMSGGMRQRVMIAMALACNPKLLIADEPTTALDVTIQAQILDLLGRLRDDTGMAVLLITHDLGVVSETADRVVVMYCGQVVEEAEVRTLFDHPMHPYTLGLLKSIPRLEDDDSKRLYMIKGMVPNPLEMPPGCHFSDRCDSCMDICRTKVPELVDVDGHKVRCFLYESADGEVKSEEAIARAEAEALADVEAAREVETAEALLSAEDLREAEIENTASNATASAQAGAVELDILLDVQHLTKRFAADTNFFGKATSYVQAVDDVSFQIRKGEAFGLVGESGCGKTTVGKMLVNLLKPTSGKIVFDGKELTAMKPAERKQYCKDIQLIFQDPYASLNPRMRIGDIIAEPIITNNILPKDQVEDRVNELLERVGLANYMRNRYPHEFSGGQRQRVGIARALAVNPKLIVCDEPVSALDVSIQAQVLNLLDELKEQFGLTYLFIAHGLNVVKHVSDRVGVMYLGKMMEIAPKKALYADPLSPYTQALLSAIPSVDPAAKKERIILEGDVPSPIDPPPGCRFASRCFAKVNGCDEVMPPLVEVKPDHCVACHRYDKGGPGTAVI